MSDRFLVAYDALPTKTRARVREQLELLQSNPAHPSLNYETIKNAGDPRMRSMRVNSNYRIILAHPNGSGTYVLLWVDTHDEAYTWAVRHRIDEGDERRGLAIVAVSEPTPIANVARVEMASATPTTGVLGHCADQEIMEAGVPAMLIPTLRQCVTENDLLDVLVALRQEVAEQVMRLATGQSLERQSPVENGSLAPADDATDASTVNATPGVPTSPATLQHDQHEANTSSAERASPAPRDALETALERAESGRRFVILSSLHALEQALDYPLERWRLFLHPDQRVIVSRRFTGPTLVSGGAGTGKTVVGLHRAYHLAKEVFTAPDDRILLTTFTRTLALNLAQLMDSLCGKDTALRSRIEVVNTHALAARLRHLAGESFKAIDDRQALEWMTQVALRHDTLQLPAPFYLAEWLEVVQAREALDESAYMHVDRVGRGRPLSRRQRSAIWSVLAAYQARLVDNGVEDWPTCVRRARELFASGALTLPIRYRAAIIDEAQDMSAPEMRLLVALVGQGPDSLLLLGDTRQQIYAHGSAVPEAGISIGRRHVRLHVNYRTTEQIGALAARVLRDGAALNGEPLPTDDSVSLLSGPPPTIRAFGSVAAEQAALITALTETMVAIAPDEIAVIVHTNTQATHYHQALQKAGVPVALLATEEPNTTGIRVTTMHRAKGIEFRAVFIVGCTSSAMAHFVGDDDPASRADHEARERHLLYVAMTRARDLLWISGAAPLSSIVTALGNPPV